MALQAAKKPVVRKSQVKKDKEKTYTFIWEGSDRKVRESLVPCQLQIRLLLKQI